MDRKRILRFKAMLPVFLLIVVMTACQHTSENSTGSINQESELFARDNEKESVGNHDFLDLSQGEEYWKEDSKEYSVAVRVTINPDAILYLNDTEVVGVNYLNEDAKEVYSTEWILGRRYEDVLYDMFLGAEQAGFLKEGAQISVEIIEEKSVNHSTDYVYDWPVQILDKMGDELSADVSVLLNGKTEEEWTEYTKNKETNAHTQPSETLGSTSGETQNADDNHQNTDDNHQNADGTAEPHVTICMECNGSGTVPCKTCGGDGEVIRIETHEELVRNDYVCETCGGKGWIDDGMHGGKTAECGFCTTNGGSGPFRELAFDVVIVEEEFPEQCPQCGGSGKEQCPVCGGAGSY